MKKYRLNLFECPATKSIDTYANYRLSYIKSNEFHRRRNPCVAFEVLILETFRK